jgi:hypothetical protein
MSTGLKPVLLKRTFFATEFIKIKGPTVPSHLFNVINSYKRNLERMA